jgi:hypothetical protein
MIAKKGTEFDRAYDHLLLKAGCSNGLYEDKPSEVIAAKLKRVRVLARVCRWLDRSIFNASHSAVEGVRVDRWNTERRQKQRLLMLVTQQTLIEELL